MLVKYSMSKSCWFCATVSFTTAFQHPLRNPSTTVVTAEPVKTIVPDKICGGTGKIPLNRLPLVNSLKKSFSQVQQVRVLPYQAPIVAEGELPEELIGQEYSTDQWIQEHQGHCKQD